MSKRKTASPTVERVEPIVIIEPTETGPVQPVLMEVPPEEIIAQVPQEQIIIDEPVVFNKEVVEAPVVIDTTVFTQEVVEQQDVKPEPVTEPFNPHKQKTCILSALLATEGTLEAQLANLSLSQDEQTGPLDVSCISDYPEKFIQKQIFPLYERLGVDTSKAVYFVHGSKQSVVINKDERIKIKVRHADEIDLFIGYGLLDQLRAKLS